MSGQMLQQFKCPIKAFADNNVHRVTYLQNVVVTTSEFLMTRFVRV